MIYSSDAMQIDENLYCLGPQTLPSFLLDGEEPVMFDAGMSFAGEHYQAELEKVLQGRPLSYLFLSHVHFDHCGAAAFLKQLYPNLTICASAEAAEIIQKPNALALIGKLNNLPGLREDQKFQPFSIDRVLQDNESIHPGGDTSIRVMAAPGHTRDMLAFYLEERRVLIPSEAAGVPSGKDKVYTEFLVDCESYFRSLQKLSLLDFDTILFAHAYIYTGDEAKSYFNFALDQGFAFRDKLSNLIDQFDDQTEPIIQVMKQEEYDNAEEPKQLEEAYMLNLEAKIKAVRKWRLQEASV